MKSTQNQKEKIDEVFGKNGKFSSISSKENSFNRYFKSVSKTLKKTSQ